MKSATRTSRACISTAIALPLDAKGASGYLLEYGAALWHETRLAWKIFRKHGFDTIQGCNPPGSDFRSLPAQFKLFGKRYIFDHHDINPELYEAKFGKRGFFWRLMVLFEKLNFWFSQCRPSPPTKAIKADRASSGAARWPPRMSFIVRSGPGSQPA